MRIASSYSEIALARVTYDVPVDVPACACATSLSAVLCSGVLVLSTGVGCNDDRSGQSCDADGAAAAAPSRQNNAVAPSLAQALHGLAPFGKDFYGEALAMKRTPGFPSKWASWVSNCALCRQAVRQMMASAMASR